MTLTTIGFSSGPRQTQGHFHDDLDKLVDVSVARVASLYSDNQGGRYTLIINEAMFFGDSMDHSLINPNQIRDYGLPVSDNPYDDEHPMGIEHEETFIPFKTEERSTIYFNSSIPIDTNLETLPHIVLTGGDTEWNLATVQMSRDKPYGAILSSDSKINQ
ncbi:hypothetical protein ACHAWF_014515 [Thalassiosira exigua]